MVLKVECMSQERYYDINFSGAHLPESGIVNGETAIDIRKSPCDKCKDFDIRPISITGAPPPKIIRIVVRFFLGEKTFSWDAASLIWRVS